MPTNASVTFLIYENETGGEPLFSETQSVAVDASGHFKAQIGATLTNGIPIDLFASGEARWLSVEVAGEPAQPRVLLASVPYALKAADAATLGGLPASAFALASTKSFASAAVLTPEVTTASAPITTTTGGFSGYIPVFTGPTTISNSTIYQNADGIGINGIPYAALDVSGRTIFRGTMVVSRNGNATSTTGVGSVPLQFWANNWNSTINGPVQPVMQMQAEPTGNNTASPGATLNLLYNNGTVLNASETGLYFNANGTIHFAPGQTFPGMIVPSGVVDATSYNLGGALFAIGSQSTSNVFLGFAGNTSTTGFDNTASGFHALHSSTSSSYNTANGAYTLFGNTTGTDNTASGALALYANTTGSDNTASGFFAMYQNTTGIQNTAYGSHALEVNMTGNYNTANGYFALYSNTTGSDNTANGTEALHYNTTGATNTANGYMTLYFNSTGYLNTAIGFQALTFNTTGHDNVGIGNNAGVPYDGSDGTGSNNIAIGDNAAFGTGSISNATAIGAYAEADQSNTLVLGCIAVLGGCPVTTSVGIGTKTPDNLLTVNGSADKPGGGSWGTYSDGRLKTVNGSFSSGLGQVMQLRPIRYRYKPDNGMGIRDADEHIGVVAQEVQRVIPEAVTENNKGYLLVNNDPIIWSMVNAIKEQQREIEQRRIENQEQKTLLRAQSTAIEEQRKMLRAQSAINGEQEKMLRAQSAAMESLAAEVRETRQSLREVKAQIVAGQAVTVASK